MVFVPLASTNEVWFVFCIASEMDTTGQVINCTVGLVAPAILAKKLVMPGAAAVIRALPLIRPLPVVARVATVWFRTFQLNGPTVAVISTP